MLQALERERLMALPSSNAPLPMAVEGDAPPIDGTLLANDPALQAAMQARRGLSQRSGSAARGGTSASMYPEGLPGGSTGMHGKGSGGGFGRSGDAGGGSFGSAASAPIDGTSVQRAQWETVDPAVLERVHTEAGPAALSTGRWGEKLISSMMQHAMPADQVDWVNAEEEQGLPYDVCVRRGGEIVLYAEVKSTAEEAKTVFELTLAELDLARQVGPRYTIYRVFSACSAAPRVAQLLDPARQLAAGCMQLLVAPRQ